MIQEYAAYMYTAHVRRRGGPTSVCTDGLWTNIVSRYHAWAKQIMYDQKNSTAIEPQTQSQAQSIQPVARIAVM